MIQYINIDVENNLMNIARDQLPSVDFKLSINQPTGNFFYDPWIIKEEFKSTVWEKILKTLPFNVGEARLIKLEKGKCYSAHADIDDRWHINIISGNSYLIDLENKEMHSLLPNKWYTMNAGLIHSAVNFGGEDRIQLVVRHLLVNSTLNFPTRIELEFDKSVPNWRYVFDHIYSPVLNRLNKENKLAEFKLLESSVVFCTESDVVLPENNLFKIKRCIQ
jgi:hypothetical protein